MPCHYVCMHSNAVMRTWTTAFERIRTRGRSKKSTIARCSSTGPGRFRARFAPYRQFERELNFFSPVNNGRFHRRPVRQILRHLNACNNVSRCRHVNFRKKIENVYHKGSFFKNLNAKSAHEISRCCDFRPS